MTNDNADCKLVIQFSEDGKRKQRTVKISQEQAQALMDLIRQKYLGSRPTDDQQT
ncbi:hypothetical protein [Calothrix sp. NIES-2098]|uniref:hypothetical protein n=1 Tax=Calothrix sp. NIES-2098 TaxID=1954171 RepID=UPI000B60AC9A|nr:hypothetical protein NIES2098_34450 [Calothrix sp. NIES-2098]